MGNPIGDYPSADWQFDRYDPRGVDAGEDDAPVPCEDECANDEVAASVVTDDMVARASACLHAWNERAVAGFLSEEVPVVARAVLAAAFEDQNG
jgi:hypothetical protein